MKSSFLHFLAAAATLAATASAQTPSNSKVDKGAQLKLPKVQAATSTPNTPTLRTPQSPGQIFVNGSDACATPDAITGSGPFAFDTNAATTGTQGQSEAACNFFGTTGIDSDVWFKWTAGFTGTARVDLCGGSVSNDTKIAVYAGSACPGAAALACNDDACALQSRLIFSCTNGQPYVIQLGHYPTSGAPGSGSFTVTQVIVPANDNCATPTTITGAGPHNFDTTNATQGSQGQGDCHCLFFGQTGIGTDLWYSWTAPSSGPKTLSLCAGTSASLDTKVAVYVGAGCPSAAAIACDDDGCAFAGPSTLTFNATMGTTYSIQVGSYPFPGQGGTGAFTINPVAGAPANDQCTTPTVITGAGPHNFNNTTATTGGEGQCESLCDQAGTSMITNDIWFRWTSNINGPAAVTLCTGASGMDSKCAVYAGTTCPAAAALGCDDDQCGTIGGPSKTIFNAVSGNQYMIQIGNYPSTLGQSGTFTIDPYTPPPGDLCTAPIVISGTGSFPFDNTQMTTGAEGQNESSCLFFSTTAISNDVWYRWTSVCTGAVTVTLCAGATHDSKIAVYPGTVCPANGTSLACDDDFCGLALPSEVVFNATSGQSYVIQIGNFPGAASGTGTFTISCGGGVSPLTAFCFPGQGGVQTCPCNNPPTAVGLGCNNHGAGPANSAELTAAGNASIANDTCTLTSTGENNTSTTIFLQAPGSSATGVVFGAGIRCITGQLKRLYTGPASGGTITRPQGADPNIHTRSAALGDPLSSGTVRYYMSYYRDPLATGPCSNAVVTFNCSNSGKMTWAP